MLSIYILELEQNKYYVGKSKSPDVRLQDHFNSSGSSWTTKYKPIKVLEVHKNCDSFDEDKYTLMCMEKYGIENVRGGSFCEINLSKTNVETINKMLIGSTDKCYNCHKSGHFANECPNKKSNWSSVMSYVKNVIKLFNNGIFQKHVVNEEAENIKEKKIYKCYKCGREGHFAGKCYAKYHVNGKQIKNNKNNRKPKKPDYKPAFDTCMID
jgi:hypothetical protein